MIALLDLGDGFIKRKKLDLDYGELPPAELLEMKPMEWYNLGLLGMHYPNPAQPEEAYFRFKLVKIKFSWEDFQNVAYYKLYGSR